MAWFQHSNQDVSWSSSSGFQRRGAWRLAGQSTVCLTPVHFLSLRLDQCPSRPGTYWIPAPSPQFLPRSDYLAELSGLSISIQFPVSPFSRACLLESMCSEESVPEAHTWSPWWMFLKLWFSSMELHISVQSHLQDFELHSPFTQPNLSRAFCTHFYYHWRGRPHAHRTCRLYSLTAYTQISSLLSNASARFPTGTVHGRCPCVLSPAQEEVGPSFHPFVFLARRDSDLWVCPGGCRYKYKHLRATTANIPSSILKDNRGSKLTIGEGGLLKVQHLISVRQNPMDHNHNYQTQGVRVSYIEFYVMPDEDEPDSPPSS